MKKESRQNFDEELFYRLISAENAFKGSVHEPLSIGHLPRSHDIRNSIWYYTLNGGEEIIKNRLTEFSDDIKNAIEHHENLLLKFYSVKIGIIDNDRSRVSGEVKGLCRKLQTYLDFVKSHQGNAQKESFLYFPSCNPCYYILVGKRAKQLDFNYGETEYDAREEIKKLLEINELFLRSEENIPTENFSPPLLDLLPSREYQDNIDFVKQKLKDEFSFSV